MMRKEARLNVEDRIRVAVNSVGEAAEAIDEHRAYVCDETLAVELRCSPPPEGWIAREADLEGARVSHRPDARDSAAGAPDSGGSRQAVTNAA